VVGPALPPGFKRQDEDEAGGKEDASGLLGPALPPGYTPELSNSEEDDDYVITNTQSISHDCFSLCLMLKSRGSKNPTKSKTDHHNGDYKQNNKTTSKPLLISQ